jgi:hypothetical protein
VFERWSGDTYVLRGSCSLRTFGVAGHRGLAFDRAMRLGWVERAGDSPVAPTAMLPISELAQFL